MLTGCTQSARYCGARPRLIRCINKQRSRKMNYPYTCKPIIISRMCCTFIAKFGYCQKMLSVCRLWRECSATKGLKLGSRGLDCKVAQCLNCSLMSLMTKFGRVSSTSRLYISEAVLDGAGAQLTTDRKAYIDFRFVEWPWMIRTHIQSLVTKKWLARGATFGSC